MRKIDRLILPGCVLLFMVVGCAPTSHFGVSNKALTAPDAFRKTEAAIASAETSAGAKYCPDKIAKAKELGKEAAEIYWTCRTDEAMLLLAEARKLAKEAESCQPPAVVTPTPPSPPSPPSPPPSPPPPRTKQPISFHSVYFDFDESNLKPEAKTELDRAARIMQNNQNVMIELQGNTDSVGTDLYNKALGDRRAKAVFDYLIFKGVNPERLREISFGEGEPVATNATDAGRTRNRRVDLVIFE